MLAIDSGVSRHDTSKHIPDDIEGPRSKFDLGLGPRDDPSKSCCITVRAA